MLNVCLLFRYPISSLFSPEGSAPEINKMSEIFFINIKRKWRVDVKDIGISFKERVFKQSWDRHSVLLIIDV